MLWGIILCKWVFCINMIGKVDISGHAVVLLHSCNLWVVCCTCRQLVGGLRRLNWLPAGPPWSIAVVGRACCSCSWFIAPSSPTIYHNQPHHHHHNHHHNHVYIHNDLYLVMAFWRRVEHSVLAPNTFNAFQCFLGKSVRHGKTWFLAHGSSKAIQSEFLIFTKITWN